MYKGFNLKLEKNVFIYYLDSGLRQYETQNNHTKKFLDNFLLSDGILDMTKLSQNWFPEIKADVFISHSHVDKDLAISFSGWLLDNFNLISFVDSCVWGYSNDLLKEIDNKFCRNGSETYSYENRNYSTSHVHTMLSTALTKMIDKSECLFFLNTPNSLVVKDVIENKTNSPWIYSEITASETIRKIKPEKYEFEKTKYFTKGQNYSQLENRRFLGEYDVSLKHLIDFSTQDLVTWTEIYHKSKNATEIKKYSNALYYLYDLKLEE
jgi:hypothetical protein